MNKKIEKKDLRQFGIILGIILLAIGSLHYFKGHFNVYPYLLGFGGMFLVAGLICPAILKPFYIVFAKVAHAIGWFNTRVILILVYYLILTPIGLVMRILRHDPLKKKQEKGLETYWVKRENTISAKESFEKQF